MGQADEHRRQDADRVVRPLVTLDLFSALIDSRTGGGTALSELARERSWSVTGEAVYSAWDSTNKELQRQCRTWVPFRELSEQALAATYRDLGLPGDPAEDTERLLASVADWPLWPDVAEGLPVLASGSRVGVLSNVDDDIFARTRVAPLVADGAVLTSERLRSYKPSHALYHEAARRAGRGYVHVATSARDVRGALDAGISTIRLRRPGHRVDPDGPVPPFEAADLAETAALLPQLR
ncbi:haloacid dehalogenase [Pseudonocardia xinjiangensis]|uniref:haloacid dehalogenase n=1 Tax=Pseudonocardia xinjiangensis TaxID=75289 RepID=UPI003D8DB2DA